MRDVDDEGLLLRTIGPSLFAFVCERNGQPMILGSGTLISFGDRAGFLTCAHVANALASVHEFSVLCYRQRSNDQYAPKIRYGSCKVSAMFGKGDRSGPDLAFLELSPYDLSNLSAFATITNGDKRSIEAASPSPAHDRVFDVIAGVIDEWTEGPTSTERGQKFNILTFANIGTCTPTTGAAGYDFATFRPRREQTVARPKRYGGTSGAAWWRLFFSADELIEARLLGVAFYQQADAIICHGPGSVFDLLRKKIDAPA